MLPRTHATEVPPQPRAGGLIPLDKLADGRLFMRPDYPTEILAPVIVPGVPRPANIDWLWCVVIAVDPASDGFVPGQLLRLPSALRVRPVFEVRGAAYTASVQ